MQLNMAGRVMNPYLIMQNAVRATVVARIEETKVKLQELERIQALLTSGNRNQEDDFEQKKNLVNQKFNSKKDSLSNTLSEFRFVLQRIEFVEEKSKLMAELEKLEFQPIEWDSSEKSHLDAIVSRIESKSAKLQELKDDINELILQRHPEHEFLKMCFNDVKSSYFEKLNNAKEKINKIKFENLRKQVQSYRLAELKAEMAYFPARLDDLVQTLATLTPKHRNVYESLMALCVEGETEIMFGPYAVQRDELVETTLTRLSDFRRVCRIWRQNMQSRIDLLQADEGLQRMQQRQQASSGDGTGDTNGGAGSSSLTTGRAGGSRRSLGTTGRAGASQSTLTTGRAGGAGIPPFTFSNRHFAAGSQLANRVIGTRSRTHSVLSCTKYFEVSDSVEEMSASLAKGIAQDGKASSSSQIYDTTYSDEGTDSGEDVSAAAEESSSAAAESGDSDESMDEEEDSRKKRNQYMCGDCHLTFTYKTMLAYHTEHFHGKNAVIQMLAIKPRGFLYRCTKCTSTFKGQATVIRHLRSQHQFTELPHTCNQCNKKFLQRFELVEHKHICKKNVKVAAIIFHGKLPTHNSKCLHCKQQFSSHKTLDKHSKRCHPGKPVFKCFICRASYKAYSAYFTHIHYIHANNTFVCKVCGKKSKTPAQLKRHTTNVHSEKKSFECNICHAKFRCQDYLNGHKIKCHSGKWHHCNDCEFKSRNRQALKTHVFRHHT